jgi:hypothetical protein
MFRGGYLGRLVLFTVIIILGLCVFACRTRSGGLPVESDCPLWRALRQGEEPTVYEFSL